MSKKFKYGIIATTIIIAAVGYAIYQIKHKAANNQGPALSQAEQRELDKVRKKFGDKLAEAEKSLAIVDTDEKKFEWLRKKGDALRSLGRYDEAKQAYEEALKIKLDSAAVYTQLYALQVEMGDLDAAKASILKAIELTPNSSRWKEYVKFSKEKLGASNEALEELYKQALASTKGDVEVIKAYAKFLESIGNKQGAIEQWQKAIEVDAEDKVEYEAEIARLRQ